MSLENWLKNRWLKEHHTSAKEISALLSIVERDLADTKSNISDDWQFGIAYNAALKLCTILLYAEGYKPEKKLYHYRTVNALPLILGNHHKSNADYLDLCRMKRNTLAYTHTGGISESDVQELINFVVELKTDVLKWLEDNHPELISIK